MIQRRGVKRDVQPVQFVRRQFGQALHGIKETVAFAVADNSVNQRVELLDVESNKGVKVDD